jgi:hypothetical protein
MNPTQRDLVSRSKSEPRSSMMFETMYQIWYVTIGGYTSGLSVESMSDVYSTLSVPDGCYVRKGTVPVIRGQTFEDCNTENEDTFYTLATIVGGKKGQILPVIRKEERQLKEVLKELKSLKVAKPLKKHETQHRSGAKGPSPPHHLALHTWNRIGGLAPGLGSDAAVHITRPSGIDTHKVHAMCRVSATMNSSGAGLILVSGSAFNDRTSVVTSNSTWAGGLPATAAATPGLDHYAHNGPYAAASFAGAGPSAATTNEFCVSGVSIRVVPTSNNFNTTGTAVVVESQLHNDLSQNTFTSALLLRHARKILLNQVVSGLNNLEASLYPVNDQQREMTSVQATAVGPGALNGYTLSQPEAGTILLWSNITSSATMGASTAAIYIVGAAASMVLDVDVTFDIEYAGSTFSTLVTPCVPDMKSVEHVDMIMAAARKAAANDPHRSLTEHVKEKAVLADSGQALGVAASMGVPGAGVANAILKDATSKRGEKIESGAMKAISNFGGSHRSLQHRGTNRTM